MNFFKKFFLIGLLFCQSAQADIMETLGLKKPDQSLDVVLGNEKKSELIALKTDLESLEKQEQEYWQEHAPKSEKLKTEIAEAEAALQEKEGNKEFLNKKLLLLKTIKQSVSTIKGTWKEIISQEKQHITVLQNYIKDPEFESLQLEKKSFNSFRDLQELNEQIAGQEEKFNTVRLEKAERARDLANRKKKESTTQEAYKEKVQEQTNFAQGKNQEPLPDSMDAHQYGKILDLQVMLARYEKEVASFRVKEEEIHLATVISQFEIEEKKLEALKRKRDLMARMTLRVDKNDVAQTQQNVAERKKKYLNQAEVLSQKIEKLAEEEEKEKEVLRLAIEQHKVNAEDPLLLQDWSFRPSSSTEYFALGQVGNKQEEVALIERKIDLLRAQSEMEKAEFNQEEVSANIVKSWYKIKHQEFKTNEEFSKELKQYESVESELERERTIFEEKRNTATGRLNLQNKALSNIKELQKQLKAKQETLFKDPINLKHCLDAFAISQALVSKQIEITGKLIETYSKILVSLDRSKRQVSAMVAELQRVSLWHRSGRAISWQGLRELIPDLQAFLIDVKTLAISYLSGFKIALLYKKFSGFLNDPVNLLFFIIKLLLALALFFFLKNYLPVVSSLLAKVSQERWGTYLVSLAASMLFEFLNRHLTPLFIWLVFFWFFGVNASPEIPGILFYLVSIVYLLYICKRFTSFLTHFNTERNYIFYSESFQSRFILFLNWFLSLTVIIFFFREAFILATYTKSELPDILLAFYSVLVRVLLLSLIRKEDLLSVIPSKTPLWSMVWRFVDQYYYSMLLIFVVIMIMTDPHIGGYNNLVSFLARGVLGTVLIGKFFYELYIFFRRSSSFLFFLSDGETLKERFQLSKTFYGVSVIVLFIGMSLVSAFCIAWMWGMPVSLKSFVQFFTDDRMTIMASSGQIQKISILDLIKTMLFIPLGLLVGFVIDRFIVHRIFSVLLVNPGVHNAVSTITYYIVVITVITVGLWSEGFGFVIAFYIAPILLGIAWAMRDIFNDFVAYFIILIQRPLKVGDYIKLDSEVSGVVRSITPRAVIVRRKKGFCLIIPNSRIVRDTITNWDYNLNFICCPDIKVQVPYRFDPQKIKEILAKAVDDTSNVLKTPGPVIRLDEFAPSGFDFMVRVFTSPENTLLQWEISSEVRLSIIKHLRQNGMEIAFPVRIIKMSHVEGTLHESVAPDDSDKSHMP